MKVIHLKGKYDRTQKKRGYERTYEFYDEGGNLCWSGDVYGECLKAPTVYHSSDGARQNFRMTAKGKLLNATYYLDDAQGTRFATLTRKGVGFRWKVLGEHNQDMGRFIDPASRKEAFLRELFSALPDGYALISGNDLIATVQNEALAPQIRLPRRNIIGTMLEKVFKPHGLTLRLEPPYWSTWDPRILIAGMTLLQVHDITGVRRQ